MNILKKANEIVNQRGEEKERQYGPFSLCNKKAADIASVLTGKRIVVQDIYYFQIALKLARQSHQHKEDNLLDLCAYIGALNNYKENINVESDITENDEPLPW